MKSSSYNTSYYFGLDKTVWLVMIVVVILSIGLMGYKKVTYEPCIEFSISSKGFSGNTNDHYLIGEDIRFTISTRDAKNVRWNFGDSAEERGSTIITHNYTHDGKFDVIATINGKCESITTVYVRKPNAVRNYFDQPNSAALITGSGVAEANKAALYMTNTTADSYEWSILNRNEYKTQVGKIAAFNFKTEGKYTLQLKLDNNREKIYTKEILVKPSSIQNNSNSPLETKHFNFKVLPPPPKEDAVKAPATQQTIAAAPPSETPATEVPKTAEKHFIEATEKYFQKSFEEVIKGGKPIADFDNYLCNGRGTKVLRNDKDYTTFEELYNDVKGNSKRRIDAIQLLKENDCIIMFKVKVKKKNILGVWVDR